VIQNESLIEQYNYIILDNVEWPLVATKEIVALKFYWFKSPSPQS